LAAAVAVVVQARVAAPAEAGLPRLPRLAVEAGLRSLPRLAAEEAPAGVAPVLSSARESDS
jgi:hypothetical protein